MGRKRLSILTVFILLIALPLLLVAVKQRHDNRTRATAPDQLEAEGGVLGGNAIVKADSTASGGQYILFDNQSSTGIYGPGVNIDSKNNYQVGWTNNQKVAHKFRASTTSNLKEVLTTFRMGPIYSGGTGGKIKISVQTEDGTLNHFPSGTILSSVEYIPGNVEGGATTRLAFPTPASLTKGNLYYIVFENIDPLPTTNFVSVNHIYTFEKMTPRQPILSDNDFGVFTKSTSGWTLKPNDTPTLDLVYADGTHDGIAYLQAFYDSEGTSAQEIISRISGSQMAREIFTVSGGNRTVTKAYVRVGREFGNSPLTVSLKTGTGTLIESKTIPASSVAQWAEYVPSQIYGTTSPTWASVTFSNPQTLTNGQTYQLVLSSPADSKYLMLPIRYVDFTPGFNTASTAMQSYAFRDGRAQDSQNSGQTWENVYSFQSWSNMQFYFTTSNSTSTLPVTGITVPANIDRTGNSDVTLALNNFITSVPNGSTIIFPPGSIYLLSQGIQFKDRSSLTFYGYGSKLKLAPSAGFGQLQSLFLLGKGYNSFFGGTNNNIVIRGFELQASNPTPSVFSGAREHQHAVEINNSQGVEVYDILAYGIGGDFVKIGSSSNVRIHNNKLLDSGRQGVSVISGSDILIENNDFGRPGYYMLDVEPNNDTESATDITFRNNTAIGFGPETGVGHGFVACGSGEAYLNIGNITVTGNTLTGSSNATLDSYFNQNQHRRLYNITFTNNKVSQARVGPVLEFKSIDGLTVKDNTQPLTSGSLYSITNSTGVISSPNTTN